MGKNTVQDAIYLLSCAVNNKKAEPDRIKKMDLTAVYSLCSINSLTSAAYFAIEKSGYKPDEGSKAVLEKWQQERDKDIRRIMLMDAEREALCTFLESKGIWYLPLKGIIIKDMYPHPAMRRMADNDILFDSDYREQVHDFFVSRSYTVKSYCSSNHDVYQKKPIYNFEMHTALFEDFKSKVWADYYSDIMKLVQKKDGKNFEYEFSPEEFYIYFLCHAKKHHSGSGTGLRTLLDFYIINRYMSDTIDIDKIGDKLKELEIYEYENSSRALAQKLFSEEFDFEELSEAEKAMLSRYTDSGTYGTVAQRVKNRVTEDNTKKPTRNRKIKYIFSRMFPSRAFMENWCYREFKVGYKRPLLLPAAYIWRLIKSFFVKSSRWVGELRTVKKL